MFDMATITTAVGGIKGAIEIAKLLKDSSDSLEKAEVKLKLADLIGALADVRTQMSDIKEALIESENEKKELKEKLELKAKLEFETPYYWHNKEDRTKDGPFCQLCYDKEKKVIRLQPTSKQGLWECFSCNKTFKNNEYIPQIYGRKTLSQGIKTWNI